MRVLHCPRTLATAVLAGLFLFGAAPGSVCAEPRDEGSEWAEGADPARILGHWQRGKGEAVIEISEHDGVYRGVIVWSQRRPETVGIEVFRGLRYDSKSREWRGRAYSIKRDREVPIDVRLLDQGHVELTAHILIFTKDVDFHRVSRSKLAALRAKNDL